MSTATQQADYKQVNRSFARTIAARYQSHPLVRGVVIGGSIARNQDWEHSDLELGVLVSERLPDGHFHIMDGRGVELFQFTQADLEQQLAGDGPSDADVAAWPIQFYQAEIVSDPTGILQGFKQQFDTRLFSPGVVALKRERHLAEFDSWFNPAKELLQANKPRSALAKARYAFNSLILAFYWQHGILPRSQNRTEYLLRQNCRRLGRADFYQTFYQLYSLGMDLRTVRRAFARCHAETQTIFATWGKDLPDFFQYAVDGELRWGQPRSILTVYRLYLALCLDVFMQQPECYDDPSWQAEHADLLQFLGLKDYPPVQPLFNQIEGYRRELGG